MDASEGETFHLDDIHVEGPELDVPDPPTTLPYEAFEDYRSREILVRNGIDATGPGIVETLQTRDGPLQAAAAHTAGSLGLKEAEPVLAGLLDAPDALVAVEAAYSLVRLGVPEGRATLTAALQASAEFELSPPVAAGYLAQLGDGSGSQTVARALRSRYDPVRMTACKQLYFFARLEGFSGGVEDLFRTALADPNPTVQWQALVQLRMLAVPSARPLLEEYLRSGADQDLKEVASAILGSRPDRRP